MAAIIARSRRGFQSSFLSQLQFWLAESTSDANQLSMLYGQKYFDRYAERGVSEPAAATSLLDRLRIKLAWKMDYGRTRLEEVEHLLDVCGGRLCDIGCGNGDLLKHLNKQGRQLVGVDPDAAARERCKASGILALEGTAECLPTTILNGSFDVVVISHVLEHCHDPVAALANGARILRPSGAMIVEVPNANSTGATWQGSTWFHADYGRHVNFFGERSLRAVAELAGLSKLQISYANYVVQFTNSWINDQQGNWDRQFAPGNFSPSAERDSKARAWKLLVRTVLARRSAKYSVLRLIAWKI